jgi:hypothetical protein
MGYDLGLSMGGALHRYNARWDTTTALMDVSRHTNWLGYMDTGTTFPKYSNSQYGGYVTNVLQIANNCF